MANNVKYLSYDGLSYFKSKLDNIYASKTHTHANYLYKTIYLGGREDTKGCLVKLNITENQNAMISVKITGNSYGKSIPVFSIIEFYNYYNSGTGAGGYRIINISGTHFGYDFGKINIFIYDGYVHFWFAQNGDFQSFNIFANCTYPAVDNNINVVDTITKSVMPTNGVSYLVEFEPNKIPYGDFLPLSGGTMSGAINSKNIIPAINGNYTLGTTSLNWKNVYATKFTGSGFVHSGVTNDAANTVLTADGGYKSISDIMTLADAMVFKGVINSNTGLPATHKQGWTYRVNTAGTYAGKVCEVGDLIICITDGTSANNAHWTVAQTNTDGVVSGPASSVSGNIAAFNSTNGKSIYNTGLALSNISTIGHPHHVASTTAAGFMSISDKSKLDGIETGANKYTHPSTHAASMITGLSTVATSGSYNDLSNKPTSLPNPKALTIQGNGTTLTNGVYDGSAEKTVNITPASIGAATASHTHSADNITSGTLSVSRGGTGLSTITTGHVIIGNGTGTPTTSKIVSITNAEIDTIFAQ